MHYFNISKTNDDRQFYRSNEIYSDSTIVGKIEKELAQRGQTYETAVSILNQLFKKRRLLPNADSETPQFELEAEPHLYKLLASVNKQEPIHLILPGFPAKSPNRNKTLGPLPDLAEKHALENLQSLCDSIKDVYSPGATITICSDGRVFADLVQIPDEDVSAYGSYLRNYAKQQYQGLFEFFDLDDVFEKSYCFDIMREELLILYGESIVNLRRRCNEEKEAKAMYLGITRFIFEDYSGIEPFKSGSKTSIQKIARLIAYRVIQRSNAWTRLIEDRFYNAIRLSIHPQFRISKKIGVYLGDTNGDSWLTPWHSVAVKRNGNIVFQKRTDAERDSMLAYEDGRPSHFEKID